MRARSLTEISLYGHIITLIQWAILFIALPVSNEKLNPQVRSKHFVIGERKLCSLVVSDEQCLGLFPFFNGVIHRVFTACSSARLI